jgi:glycosyltransferase involved in cell wall biosynthesis
MSYLAAGRPLVLAMDGEVQELVNNTIGCGFVGATGDAYVFAQNIMRVYSLSPNERNAMGKAGRNHHMKYFERNIILNKLYSFILS